MQRAGLCLVLLSAALGTASALPPNSPHREGANHRVGDDSFVAHAGRAPTGADSERSRMKIHLEHVRAVLAASAATKPALAARRTELLGYLDDYIAKGITPKNWSVPWRTPVFIDDRGAICAVGYLIERSAGRALPEKIAATHRYDYLEDIAKSMPEVATWIEGSGFTLDELASIQPGYTEPEANTWQRWFATNIPDGEYRTTSGRETAATGWFRNRKMQGEWKAFAADIDNGEMKREIEDDAKVIGRGKLRNGAGRWTSYYDDGKLLAKGTFANNHPHGGWRFFHKSGHVAAIGEFRNGSRAGRWQFFHDTAAKTPIAIGAFSPSGHVTGRWQHFDAAGRLIATSHEETPSQWKMDSMGPNTGEGEVIDIVPGADRIRHSISVGTLDQGTHRLDTFSLGAERVYVYAPADIDEPVIYDAGGHQLIKFGDSWQAVDCKWTRTRQVIAKSGDVARLHGLLYRESKQRIDRDYTDKKPLCIGDEKQLDAARGKRIDALLASREKVRAQSPQFVRDLILRGEVSPDEDDRPDVEDMTRVITKHMSWYVEWPHVDGRFIQVFRTLPGHTIRHWYDEMMGNSVDAE